MHTETPNPELEAEIAALLALHPGLTRRQLLEHIAREESVAGAAKAPFPGPLREAFASDPRRLEIEGQTYTLQPVSLALLSALERFGSPFVAMVETIIDHKEKTSAEIARIVQEKIPLTIDQQISAIYCFITPIDEVEKVLDGVLPSAIECVRKTFGQKHAPRHLPVFTSAIIRHYVESFSTALEYQPKPSADGSFQSAPAMTTGSAGASVSVVS